MQNLHVTARINGEHGNSDDLSGRDALIPFEVEIAGSFTPGALARVAEERFNKILSYTLCVMVPWLLQMLAEDLEAFTEGSDRRGDFSPGELQSRLARYLFQGRQLSLPNFVREKQICLPLV